MVRRPRAALAVALTVLAGVAVVAGPALADAGDLSPLPEPTGCVSETGTSGACADGFALTGPRGVLAVGDNVYVVSSEDDSIAIFDRDPATGQLTQKPGSEGCIGDIQPCRNAGSFLDNPLDIAVSPDGTSLYVASVTARRVVILAREPATGVLRPSPQGQRCLSPVTSTGEQCLVVRGMSGPAGVTVSPDGRQIYVASVLSGAVAVVRRDPATGALSQDDGSAGCVSDSPTEGCADGRGLAGAVRVAVSPDGQNLYVVGNSSNRSDSLAVLQRASTGELSQPGSSADCFSVDGSGGECTVARRTDGAFEATVSADGASVYLASGFGISGTGGLAVFSRDAAASGALTQLAGAAGCVASGDPTDPDGCTAASAFELPLGVAVSPDDRTVAVAADGGGVVSLDRDPLTGALTPRSDATGCVTDDGSADGQAGVCGDGAGLSGTNTVSFSPDGSSIVASASASSAVVSIDRDDGAAPVVSITAGPPAQSTSTTATFAFSAGGSDVRFTCRIRPAAYAPCTSPITRTGLAPGSYTFDVMAADRFGNATSDSRTFTVLPPPPDTTITSAPPAQSTSTTATFAFTGTSTTSRFECRLQPATYNTCTSPATIANLQPGTYTFDVRAADSNGTTDPSPASRTFTVLPPPPPTTPTPPPPVADTTVSAESTSKRSQRPKSSKIAVVRVQADEKVKATAKATVSFGDRTITLKKARGKGSGTLSLKLKAKRPGDASAILGAVDRGTKVKVRVTLTLRDEAGNEETRKATITLRS